MPLEAVLSSKKDLRSFLQVLVPLGPNNLLSTEKESKMEKFFFNKRSLTNLSIANKTRLYIVQRTPLTS